MSTPKAGAPSRVCTRALGAAHESCHIPRGIPGNGGGPFNLLPRY